MREPVLLDGKLCQATITRETTGRWWVSLMVDTRAEPETRTGERVVGVGVGLMSLATTSDGDMYENPRPLGHALNELRKVKRAISIR